MGFVSDIHFDMHRNPLWLALLSLVLLVTLFFIFKAATSYIAYSSLSKQTEGTIEKVEIVPRGGNYVVWVTFSFLAEGEKITASASPYKPFYNRFSAEKKASELSQEKITVWYHPKKPLESSLQKNFPTKQVVSAVVLVLITLYFFTLGRYVGSKRPQN